VPEGSAEIRVWIMYKDRRYPGLLETWNERGGVLRGWVSYALPVNGYAGGWYAMADIRTDEGDFPNEDGCSWADAAHP